MADENGSNEPLRKYSEKTLVIVLPGDLTVFDIGEWGRQFECGECGKLTNINVDVKKHINIYCGGDSGLFGGWGL